MGPGSQLIIHSHLLVSFFNPCCVVGVVTEHSKDDKNSLFRSRKDDLFYKGYWLGGEGGGPYQYQANLVSRPNIAFARLDPGNFVLHLYEKALTV